MFWSLSKNVEADVQRPPGTYMSFQPRGWTQKSLLLTSFSQTRVKLTIGYLAPNHKVAYARGYYRTDYLIKSLEGNSVMNEFAIEKSNVPFELDLHSKRSADVNTSILFCFLFTRKWGWKSASFLSFSYSTIMNLLWRLPNFSPNIQDLANLMG